MSTGRTTAASGWFAARRPPVSAPPEAIEETPITIEDAARLMADLGFVAFRTPPGADMPDSCLMAMLQEVPTERHFDPEVATYWTVRGGHGRIVAVETGTPAPIDARFSWGRIRLVDRLGMRNNFVGFGGTLTGERIGAGALLLIFRSPAPILRLPGHSQRQDHLAEEVLAFFGRLVPHLWDPAAEALVATAAPDDLYAAFLLHAHGRIRHSVTLRDTLSDDEPLLQRELSALGLHRPGALLGGRRLLERLALVSGERTGLAAR